MSTVAPNISDGRTQAYRSAGLHLPLEVLATRNPNDLTDVPGWAGATGLYYGGSPYQGDDCVTYQVFNVSGRKNHAFQVVHAQTSSFSIQLKGSIDGTTFVSVGSAVTSDGITQVTPGLYKFFYFDITVALSNSYDSATAYGVKVVYLGSTD